MKKAEILRGVKDAEEKVERLKKDAILAKEKIIKDSKRRTLVILEDAKIEAQKDYQKRIDEIKREMTETKKKIINEGEKRAEELKATAGKNRGPAIEMLIKRFEDEVKDV